MDTNVEGAASNASAIHSELEAMRTIGEALSKLEFDARVRVLTWINAHFSLPMGSTRSPTIGVIEGTLTDSGQELPGIARITDVGLEVTVRDLKARSANDAAIRLAHIAIVAKEKLTGTKTLSSRNELLPLLKEWRVYDGNTRVALANHRGIHRDGDQLSLDAISRREAQKYIDEILDESIRGTWNPTGRVRKTGKKNSPMRTDAKAAEA